MKNGNDPLEKGEKEDYSKLNFESNVDYTTVLDNFEGPLDLLLYLIRQEKIEIRDIFVSRVTEQFLEYMKGLPYIDIDKASEYLAIASTILEIKSKSLVPMESEDEESDVSDEESMLIQALEEYKLLKEESVKLKERETVGYYYKEPDKQVGHPKIVYKDFNLDEMLKAFTDLLLRNEVKMRDENLQREIPKDTYTVQDRAQYIRKSVAEVGNISFFDLFPENASRSEIITTFLALLNLLKYQYVTVSQSDIFGNIVISHNPEKAEEEVMEEFEEFD